MTKTRWIGGKPGLRARQLTVAAFFVKTRSGVLANVTRGVVMKAYSYQELKVRHRAERNAYPQALSLRVHRSLSWLDRAERANDIDSKFIFLWIAFNAAYAAEAGELTEIEARRFKRFLRQVVSRDSKALMATILWKRYPGPVRLLLDNPYAFKPFWDFQNGVDMGRDWRVDFRNEKRRANRALASMNTGIILRILFHRLYVIRNQLIHGGATWGGKVNRSQLRDGGAILSEVVPLVIEILMDNPDTDWGQPIYPVVEAAKVSTRLPASA